MKVKAVYVVGGDLLVCNMFIRTGMYIPYREWGLDIPPDLICFTGGEDVSPHLYGEENISSYCNPARDREEQEIYEKFVGRCPMVGICRGGQFLNVMNGGKMIQHIEGHHMGYRTIKTKGFTFSRSECLHQWCGAHEPCGGSNCEWEIHEDHHQGIVPNEQGELIGLDSRDHNVEIVFYPKTKCLCFQPHPEWDHKETHDLFFNLIDQYITVKG